jgi:Na+-driven multidrug efflux pump
MNEAVKRKWCCPVILSTVWKHVCSPSLRKELKIIWSLAWPASLGSMFMDILAPINLLFCGQIGKDELAAAGLYLHECISCPTVWKQTYV